MNFSLNYIFDFSKPITIELLILTFSLLFLGIGFLIYLVKVRKKKLKL